ncbi:MAG: NAD-dependent epimerase/dehydratase family protein [Gammaproteobacteria bacterium]
MKGLILVTGANGFVGSHLCESLRQAGYKIRTLTHRAPLANQDNFQMELSKERCPPGLFANVDTVFHLAGKAHTVAESEREKFEYHQINTEGTRKLLEGAKLAGVKCFVFFSSVKAVGEIDEQPMDETLNVPASTPYGQSKCEAERLVLHGNYVPCPIVIRPSMIYGNAKKGNLSRMIKAIRLGLFPPLPELNNRRSMVHVDDVVSAAMLAATKPEAAGQIYILTDGLTYSTQQIYDWIRNALGKPQACWTIPIGALVVLAKVGDVIGKLIRRRFVFDSAALQKLAGSAWYSSAKIERELGFKPVHTLPQSLPDIVRFLEAE